MPNYKEGLNRNQQLLFPPSLDEYVNEDNPVRAIDSYVDSIDLADLGVFTSSGGSDGQPAYHPALLLKIYLYGYLNSVRSSRKLEREIKRNVEMMWLCQGLTPGYKTIANFRKDNPAILKQLFRDFVMLCRSVDLIDGALVAIDGAFLRANASKNQLISEKVTMQDMKSINEKITEYLSSLEYSDKCENKDSASVVSKQRLDQLKKRKAELSADLNTLKERQVNQYCKSDPDATLMTKPAHHLVAYNSQIAVDGKYKFIVATDISSKGVDYYQLYPMATQAKEATGNEQMKVGADAGYYNPKELKRCVNEGIDVYVPIQDKQKKQRDKGKFPRDAFHYDETNDYYICPNDKVLKRTKTVHESKGIKRFMYFGAHSVCKVCPIRLECLPEKTPAKRLWRWEHEEVVTSHRKKMSTPQAKAMIRQRAALAEHPFGTIKQKLGWSHYLVRGKTKVAGENALIMLTYNFRRLLNLIGIALFLKLIRASKSGNIESIKQEIAEYLAVLDFFGAFFRQKMSLSV
jgi:transposase